MAGRAPRAVRETEHKFRIHGLFRIPDLNAVEGVEEVDDQGVVELTATYYDTRDLRLVRDGITLRRRHGGPDEGWHLKLPTESDNTRDELQLPLSENGPPASLTTIVTAITRREPLRPAASIRTKRHRRILRGKKGGQIAELVDDNVEVLSPQGDTTARFRELELELMEDDGTAARVIDVLTVAGATEGTFVAKAVRALGPDAAEPPEVPPPTELRPADPAGKCIAAYIATHVRALRRADIGFRQSPEDPGDHVHQMRVAARRLRSGLRVFRPLLDHGWAKNLSGELAWFAHSLTELRESEVLLPRLDGVIKEIDSMPADSTIGLGDLVHAQVGGSLTEARADALSMLASDRYLQLHDSLVAAAREPTLTDAAHEPARVVFPHLVRKAWTKLEKTASQLTFDAPDSQWHDARLAAKRARYAGEAVAPALGDEAAAFANQMERLTDILGEHQDAVQAEGIALGLAESAEEDQQTLLGLGMMAGIERSRAHAARDQFRHVWPKASRPKWRRWIPNEESTHG